MGKFCCSRTVLVGTGEGAFGMAENLAFDQIARNGAAISATIRPLRPERRCSACAVTSLPVPLSPVMKTGARETPIRAMRS